MLVGTLGPYVVDSFVLLSTPSRPLAKEIPFKVTPTTLVSGNPSQKCQLLHFLLSRLDRDRCKQEMDQLVAITKMSGPDIARYKTLAYAWCTEIKEAMESIVLARPGGETQAGFPIQMPNLRLTDFLGQRNSLQIYAALSGYVLWTHTISNLPSGHSPSVVAPLNNKVETKERVREPRETRLRRAKHSEVEREAALGVCLRDIVSGLAGELKALEKERAHLHSLGAEVTRRTRIAQAKLPVAEPDQGPRVVNTKNRGRRGEREKERQRHKVSGQPPSLGPKKKAPSVQSVCTSLSALSATLDDLRALPFPKKAPGPAISPASLLATGSAVSSTGELTLGSVATSVQQRVQTLMPAFDHPLPVVFKDSQTEEGPCPNPTGLLKSTSLLQSLEEEGIEWERRLQEEIRELSVPVPPPSVGEREAEARAERERERDCLADILGERTLTPSERQKESGEESGVVSDPAAEVTGESLTFAHMAVPPTPALTVSHHPMATPAILRGRGNAMHRPSAMPIISMTPAVHAREGERGPLQAVLQYRSEDSF
ncbi:hypothetical protein KIPB_002489 [Kipferlia bialata]|uniref:Uncharacterized protein n=1 Tax=Kipferlia bialata TaxID=797122 RepID=A0A9K3CQP8_9EUKA|nr:hypothetical protein KIPB_002489 [Kipferlia bialata]|eukprot:g2489.t1